MFTEMKNGVFYSAIGKYSNVVIQFIVQMVLSRLLSPEEFGVIAVVNVFIVFFQMLADFGIGPAIIQNKELTKSDNENIFSLSIYISLFISILFALFAKPISLFYGDSNYINIVLAMSVTLFFSSAIMVPQNLLQKEKRFKEVNFYQVIGNFISGVVSITFAVLGFSYYALIIGTTIRAIFLLVIYYLQVKTKFTIRFEIKSFKKIYSFSKNQFSFNFINYFSRNADSLLVGKFISASALGYYNKAYQLALYPNTIFTTVISPVIQPILSDYQNDKILIKKTYLRVTEILATISIPLTVFLYFTSEDLILLLFGNQWGQSVPIFRILALSVWIQMVSSSSGSFFQSGNRTDLLLKSGLYSTFINLIAIIFGVISGDLYILATNLVISYSINFIQTNYLLLKTMCQGQVSEIIKPLFKPILMGIIQIVCFLIIPVSFPNLFLNFLIKGIIFAIVFISSLIITKQYKIFNFLSR